MKTKLVPMEYAVKDDVGDSSPFCLTRTAFGWAVYRDCGDAGRKLVSRQRTLAGAQRFAARAWVKLEPWRDRRFERDTCGARCATAEWRAE